MQPTQRAGSDGLVPFLVLTFGISWLLGWIPAALTGQQAMEFPTALLFALGGFGPTIAGIALLYRYETKENRRNFWRRLVDFRTIRPGWYLLIVLIFPVLTALGMGLNTLLGGEQPGMLQWQAISAQPAALIGALLVALIFGALSEELGWRGFALDRMLARWGFLRATLLLGAIWWAWHLPLFFIRGTTHATWGWGTPFFWLFLANVFPLSVLMALAYLGNGRSTLAALLMHMMYNFTLAMVFPVPVLLHTIITVLVYLATAALLWQSHQTMPAARSRVAPQK